MLLASPRLGQMLFVMFGISVLVFLIFFATPGSDPAARIAGRNAAPETLAAVRKNFGLDRPLPVQYAVMMRRLFVTRDLTSFVNRGWKVVPAVLRRRAGHPVAGARRRRAVGRGRDRDRPRRRRDPRQPGRPAADGPGADRHLDAGVSGWARS